MSLILFKDTETTGIPDWKQPSESECQPHLVQLAGLLVDEQSREIVKRLELIIKPDGWVIPDEVAAIHGITTEIALRDGVPEIDALNQLLEMWNGCTRVSHNKTFDQRIIRIATKRYLSEEISERWADKDSYLCTMRMYQQQFGGKNTNLATCYEKLTGKTLENAHTAMADTQACMEIYFALKDLQAA